MGDERRSSRDRGTIVLLLVLVLMATAALRWRLLDMPLERDEGEYAYAGWRWLAGEPPYRSAYTVKLPGTHALYALFVALFGATARGVHTGLLLVNAASIGMVFLLARRWLGGTGALGAAVSFAALSTSPALLGLAGHATHFVTLFVLGGLLLLPEPGRGGGGRAIACGLLLGLSIAMKQVGVLFVAYALWHLLRQGEAGRRPALLVAVGAALPLAALAGFVVATGVTDTFLFWTFDYAAQYAGVGAFERLPSKLRSVLVGVILPCAPFWLLAFRGSGELRDDRRLSGLVVVSLLAVLPGFHLRPHYFLVLLPALSILVGRGLMAFGHRAVASVALVAAVGWTVGWQRDVLWHLEPAAASRAVYSLNPFPESEAVAAQLAARSEAGEQIAVLGSEPQIPFLAGRSSATGYLYVYPLMEPQPYARRMQDEMIAEIEAAAPRFVVDVRVPWSWLERPDSEPHVLAWREAFLSTHYRPIGVVEISASGTVSRWDERARAEPPRTPEHLAIYERLP
jgi:hypothetical protein